MENDYVHNCKLFIEHTCGCHLNNSSPCSSLFSLDEYDSLQSQAWFPPIPSFTAKLQWVIIGSVMSLMNTRVNRKSGKNKEKVVIYHFSTQWSTCMPKDLLVLSWHWQRQANSGKRELFFQWTKYTCSWWCWQTTSQCHFSWKYPGYCPIHFQLYRAECPVLPRRTPTYKKDDIKILPSSTSKKILLCTISLIKYHILGLL